MLYTTVINIFCIILKITLYGGGGALGGGPLLVGGPGAGPDTMAKSSTKKTEHNSQNPSDDEDIGNE